VISVIVFVLMREMVLPSAAILGGTVALLLIGIIDARQAFAGFSNEAPFIIGSLLVLARAVDLSGLLQPIVAPSSARSAARVRCSLGCSSRLPARRASLTTRRSSP
jgi:hypothetical protein